MEIIGRESEKDILNQLLVSKQAELLAIYGRRRVGKTFLIRTFFEENLTFELTGVLDGTFREQLENFAVTLTNFSKSPIPIGVPDNWIQAFQLLKLHFESINSNEKQVVFIDEFPWLDSRKSGFLPAFDHFWNSWASRKDNIIVVICGSAASWMIQNIIGNRGGLHNRITQRIRLQPFSLKETELYLKSKSINLDKYQILQIFMVMGGIPHYLRDIRKGQSFDQNIDRMCFSKDGILKNEFQYLYPALFDKPERHITVIRSLANKNEGLTRTQIIETCNLSSGGSTTKLLDELLESGFITNYIPYERNSKDVIYKLTDEYSLFYLKFIEQSKDYGDGTWLQKSTTASWKSWSGFAFENICQKHIRSIKKALGIGAIYTEHSAWRYVSKSEEKGCQIDLLIDRADKCINICEIKFSNKEYLITKKYAEELAYKRQAFLQKTNTNKTLFLTMITTYGIVNNDYSTNLIQSSLKMEALFEE
jgi:uncharacterized protein